MDDNHPSIGARHPGDLTGPPAKQHGRGRMCVGCDGKLSIYNPDDWCSSCDNEEKIEVGPQEIKAKEAAKLLGCDVRQVRAYAQEGRIQEHTKRRGLGTSYIFESVQALAAELERDRDDAQEAASELDKAIAGDGDARVCCGVHVGTSLQCPDCPGVPLDKDDPEADEPRQGCGAIAKHPTNPSADNVRCELEHGHNDGEGSLPVHQHEGWLWMDQADAALYDGDGNALVEPPRQIDVSCYDQDAEKTAAYVAETARQRLTSEQAEEPEIELKRDGGVVNNFFSEGTLARTDVGTTVMIAPTYVIHAENTDREILAIEVVRDAFSNLEREERVRVIAWTLDKFDLNGNVRAV